MTTPRQVASNRANARASTGPRSAAGKARAAQNTRRHGLSIPVARNPKLAAEVEELALEIAGRDAPPGLGALARVVAEAQIDIERIRRARHCLFEDALAASVLPTNKRARLAQVKALIDVEARLDADLYIPWRVRRLVFQPAEPVRFAHGICDLAGSLARLERYERRALSRRKTAISAFDAARAALPESEGTA